ncbi:MAG: PAS domain S-box protein, partial [Deltaproteobacteria bacterium]|nr:PAS domain S-box protein [Deltaproteobacteria bacterium]
MMLIPLAVLIGINRYNQRVIHLATHKVEDIHKEISSLSDLQIALNMLIMPPNDYLITGDISERVEFNHIITEIEGHLLNISTTMRCNKCHEITDEMVKKLYRVESESFWSEEMASVKEIMDGLQIVKEKGEKIFKIEKPVGSTEGAMLMKEMDAMARNLIKEDILKHKKKDEKELISAIKESERLWRMSWFMMIGGFALSVSMGLFFAFFYSGFFVRPIKKLHHGADAIAGGDFKSRVDVKTGDELEQLANGMNEMAAQLDALYSNLNVMVEEKTKELKESEERFRVIAETAADAIITMKRPGIVTLWNKSAERIFGYTADEVMGKYLHDMIVSERYREKEREGLKSFFET